MRIKRLRKLVVLALLAGAVISAIALGAINVKSLPTATFGSPNAQSVTVTGGNFSGLGNVPALATLTAFGTARYNCTNPQGKASPGQNPVPAQPGSVTQDTGNSDHNGRGTITNMTASVSAPPTPTAVEAGCGGGGAASQGKWTVNLIPGSLTATCAELEITQGGSTIFTRTYTSNGTGTDGLTCP